MAEALRPGRVGASADHLKAFPTGEPQREGGMLYSRPR